MIAILTHSASQCATETGSFCLRTLAADVDVLVQTSGTSKNRSRRIAIHVLDILFQYVISLLSPTSSPNVFQQSSWSNAENPFPVDVTIIVHFCISFARFNEMSFPMEHDIPQLQARKKWNSQFLRSARSTRRRDVVYCQRLSHVERASLS